MSDPSLQNPPESSAQTDPLKLELEHVRYQLLMANHANQELETELSEIKRSKAWSAVRMYRKAADLPIRAARKIGHLIQGKFTRSSARGEQIATGKKTERVIAILTPTFFDYDGNNMFFGGAERYVIELVRLAHEMGYEAEVFQCGNSNWERYYFDFKVTGLDVHGDNNLLSDRFYELKRSFQLIVYSPFSLATRQLTTPSIGISHGIFWDTPIHTPAWMHAAQYANIMINAIQHCTRMVSVDTNTINWVRATALDVAGNCRYIPNFVDLDQFHPVERENASGRITALYPRRLYPPRGFWLISEILPDLLYEFPQLDFHFTGKANPKEEARVRELMEAFPGRIQWYFLPPEEMHKAYQQADIAIVPTIYSEGTSLSCLEALASGNAVITTNVGGLPNLVLDGYNGLLVEPDAASLRRAIVRLCGDGELRHRLQTNGRAVAEVFNIQRWREEWQRLFLEQLPDAKAEPQPVVLADRFAIVVPPTGMTWNSPATAAHQAAIDLAAGGYETYWIHSGKRAPNPHPNLHILSDKDDLYLRDPQLFIFASNAEDWIRRFPGARIAYDPTRNSPEKLDEILRSLKK